MSAVVPHRPQAQIRTGFAPTEGGLRLFWKAAGTGPTLICCNGVGVSTFFWKYVVERFADRFQVVVWDYRGHGRSDRPLHPKAADLSIGACADDLGRVMEAVGCSEAVLLGHSMGCQVILERALRRPDTVTGLVPMLGSAGRVLDTFMDDPRSARVYPYVFGLVDFLGDRVNRFIHPLMKTPLAWVVTHRGGAVDPLYMSREDFLPYLEHMGEIDIRLFLRMVGEAHRHDAFEALPNLTAPTLIVAAENDTFTPLWLSEKMAATVPGAELLVLADASHAALIEQPHTINHRLERFLADRVSWSPPAS